ncbi:[NiFe]-hydrogenase assembly chaperone HybE [Azospirillum rugosum]|uniref:[NiFe] hydrogenase assembly HybE family chaperone n=1 Tax=Azospirillum rugosum TaxID=416170 RepID=A0ABS4SKA3_9PROT|nr:[NiFe]-hydrogenase assembly chaperone HybE [Azospirillum rugosum]MBP2292523.1 [NiFe] hydrogenase assembly HybE family chaperone [Azospirillum rugosum]MDQ0526453.1 [NiFe] hydrogenase assembly HybE family chaperone [Azospirillum rugosum]
MDARVAALVDAYRAIGARDMADVPICNAGLSVEAVGFREQGPGWLGCVIAPWFLNAVLIPRDPAPWAALLDGDKTEITLPSGAYRFTAARMDGLGTLLVIPLVSAMNVLSSQEEARAAAFLALDTLLRAPAPTPAPEPPAAKPETPALSRRSLFRGGRR